MSEPRSDGWAPMDTAPKDDGPEAHAILILDADGDISVGYWDLEWRLWESSIPYAPEIIPVMWHPLPPKPVN